MTTSPIPDHDSTSHRRGAGWELWRGLSSRAARLFAGLHQTWRRSLQVRVVTITLVVSSLLVGGFAYLIADKITSILLDNAKTDVRARLTSGAEYAAKQFSLYSQPQEAQLQETIDGTVNYLAGGDPQQTSGVVVALTADGAGEMIERRSSPSVDFQPLISPELRAAVAGGNVANQIRTGRLTGDRDVTYLVYGSPVPTRFGQVELYYFVPLTLQATTASQARATVVATGVALVLLLGLLAALVTRLVVTPVRVAARTAQRLSAGLLDQRMAVNGEDDLALLAASFNQMATNLQRQILRLEEMSRLQRRFTSDVSHELRTPLTTVRMAADLIFAERDEFDPAVARSAELLQAELDRFEELLTDLLEISRFDAGFAVLDAEPTDLVPVVHRVVDRLAGLAERVGVPVELDVPVAPVIAEIDPRRVERVLRNLVGNAVEHGEGRPVRITLGMDETAVAITVRDHGVGLKPGEEKLVFNRFWRADPSRARQTGGTGLGLSISVEDARLHGGWLEAWGAPGQGAQFRLTLPARAGDRLTTSPLRLVPADATPPLAGVAGSGPLAIGPGPGGAFAITPAQAGPERHAGVGS
ncbi:MtrAB system histidine kinase MtrB [Micromonospora endophytica]|uniref:Sensor histidine kinase MtrB n=1 Tax=Micromonospora endophytica TaxID=515350 RepID=A0A2W2BWZ2_9ACTN|nr:MtrAB system histidine kinase MtrB [Micromonospora endophytica]PZF90632.1 two-component sensor histidine kinase [Micromonospora endophytica]RIW50801.1 sensor histidine kinase [Micromonospora endophytica]BCJ58438.1 sensor histidine kinase MtrB [Micromonospora endophytica]